MNMPDKYYITTTLPYVNAAIEETPPPTITSEYCEERGAPGVTCGLR